MSRTILCVPENIFTGFRSNVFAGVLYLDMKNPRMVAGWRTTGDMSNAEKERYCGEYSTNAPCVYQMSSGKTS